VKAKARQLESEFSQSMKVALTKDELIEQGEIVSEAQAEFTQAEMELNSMKAQFKGKMDAAECKGRVACGLIRDKFQYRPVKCRKVLDYDKGSMTLTRLDTGEMVEHRPMSEQERQMEIDFDRAGRAQDQA
jgi:hypothetical protein